MRQLHRKALHMPALPGASARPQVSWTDAAVQSAAAHLDFGASPLRICALSYCDSHMAVSLGQQADQQVQPVHLRDLHHSPQLSKLNITR